MSKFIQIFAIKDESEQLFALDDDGEVWWRDVSEGTQDGEPWTKMSSERSGETLREALVGPEREEFICVGCDAKFLHPATDGDCPSDSEGKCAHLSDAGWREVWIKVSAEKRHLFSGGRWICQKCVKRYEYDARPRRKRGRK